MNIDTTDTVGILSGTYIPRVRGQDTLLPPGTDRATPDSA
jgi:hypothetical protein